jgi:hypothetical protein
MMVTDVPGWEGVTEINERFTGDLCAVMKQAQELGAPAAAAAAAQPMHSQQQQQQQQVAGSATGRQEAAAAAAAMHAQEQHQHQHQQQQQQQAVVSEGAQASGTAQPPAAAGGGGADSSMGRADGLDWDDGQPAAVPGSLWHTLQAINMGERVLSVLIEWMMDRPFHAGYMHMPYATAMKLQQREIKSREQERRLESLSSSSARGDRGESQLLSLVPPTVYDPQDPSQLLASTWEHKAFSAAALLEDGPCLDELQVLERHRLSYNTSDDWVLNLYKLEAAGSWAPAVDALRAAAASQWSLLGAAGQQKQQQQWQQQVSDGEQDWSIAVTRAAYLLLLLRILEPISTPEIRHGARVVVLRYDSSASLHHHYPCCCYQAWDEPEQTASSQYSSHHNSHLGMVQGEQ